MLQRILVLILLLGIMFVIVHSSLLGESKAPSVTLVLGFMLLAAYCTGQVLEKIKLPKISGYIMAGLVFGPYFMGLVSTESIKDLSFINSLALAFIAFCAGGELKLSHLKNQLKSMVNLTISQTIIVFIGVAFVSYYIIEFIPALKGIDHEKRLVIALIFGIISVARSPSSTIAIISETKAQGKYTDIVLSVTIVKDVVVIVLFGIIVSVSNALIVSTASIDWMFFLVLLFEIIISVILGVFLAMGIIFLIERVKVEFPIVILAVGFFVVKFSHQFSIYLHEIHYISLNIEPLLICIAAGFTVQNFSEHGNKFLSKMDSVSMPVFVIFFAMAGASINVDILRTSWFFGLIIVAVRLVMLGIASIAGGLISRDEPLLYKNYWFGFITQAGVSLGLLTEIVRRFPTVGLLIQSLLIAAITINQLIGPVAFKWALKKVGDAGRKQAYLRR